jgi:hypothetical protein
MSKGHLLPMKRSASTCFETSNWSSTRWTEKLVGSGFKYCWSDIIRTIVEVLQRSLPAFSKGGALQVGGNQDAYSLTGENKLATMTPRSQVSCQHVMCLTDADKSRLCVDGFMSHDVLAINLQKKHKDLTKNFCYPKGTVSYIGAAVWINGVTLGSLCMAITKMIEQLGWND